MDLDLEKCREIVLQVRELLEPLIPVPPPLEDLPLELWLMRAVSIETAADLLGLSPATVRRKFKNKLIQIDDRRYGLRLFEALRLGELP
jgi:hypothetical protein